MAQLDFSWIAGLADPLIEAARRKQEADALIKAIPGAGAANPQAPLTSVLQQGSAAPAAFNTTIPAAPGFPSAPGASARPPELDRGIRGPAPNLGIRAAATRGRNLPDASTAQAIAASAQRLGVDPVDLATVISYESAGTFSPSVRGGAGNRHIGLIQFGPNEQQQYGASQNQTVEEQLQAAERYLTSRGLKPGMGLLDLYSTINAGRPGRYGASDANNGGAPGTVADKVNYQMGAHRARAQAMFNALGNQGGTQVAAPLPPPRPSGLGGGVQVAENEGQTQNLERALGMVASSDPRVVPTTPEGRAQALGIPAPTTPIAPQAAQAPLQAPPMARQAAQAPIQTAQAAPTTGTPAPTPEQRARWAGMIQAGGAARAMALQEIQELRKPVNWQHVTTPDGRVLAINPRTNETRVIDAAPKPVNWQSIQTADGRRFAFNPQTLEIRPQDQTPSSTPFQKDYEYAVSKGYKGTPEEWKRAGSPQVNIDQKTQGAFRETLAKKSGERWDEMIGTGQEAESRMVDLQNLRDASRAIGQQGSTALLKERLGPILEGAGVDVTNLSDIQMFQQTVAKLAPGLRKPGSGTTSDRDLEQFLKSLGGVTANPAAREMAIDVFQAEAQNQAARGQIASRVADETMTPEQGRAAMAKLPKPLDIYREFRRQNPTVVNEALKAGPAPAQPSAAAPRRVSEEEFKTLRSGTRFIAPDGSLRVKP